MFVHVDIRAFCIFYISYVSQIVYVVCEELAFYSFELLNVIFCFQNVWFYFRIYTISYFMFF